MILTFIAQDRTGLVETLSDAVTEAGGNWLESRMVHLAEKFAGIARIEIPADKASSMKQALRALEAEGFRLTIEDASMAAPPSGRPLKLELVGPDHPGIVRDISHCLSKRDISVEEMETDVREAPMGGGAQFYARIYVHCPAGLDENELREALEKLSAVLMVDISLREET